MICVWESATWNQVDKKLDNVESERMNDGFRTYIENKVSNASFE